MKIRHFLLDPPSSTTVKIIASAFPNREAGSDSIEDTDARLRGYLRDLRLGIHQNQSSCNSPGSVNVYNSYTSRELKNRRQRAMGGQGYCRRVQTSVQIYD